MNGPTRAAKAGKKIPLYRHDKPEELIKDGPLSCVVLFESPFNSVLTVSRGPTPLLQ